MSASFWPTGLLLLALAGVTDAGGAERGAPTKQTNAADAVEAEMLRDLDLLSSPDYPRDREVARRLGLLQRLRMLESQRAQEEVGAPVDGGDSRWVPAPAQDGR